MDSLDARALARAKIRGLRQRVLTIRRRVLAFACAIFTVAWVVIFARMTTGDDPVLGAQTPTTASAAPTKTSSGEEGESLSAPDAEEAPSTRHLVMLPDGQLAVVSQPRASNVSPPVSNLPSPAPAPLVTRQS
jgi:hypothetical protein